jgi:hypothetical protein
MFRLGKPSESVRLKEKVGYELYGYLGERLFFFLEIKQIRTPIFEK